LELKKAATRTFVLRNSNSDVFSDLLDIAKFRIVATDYQKCLKTLDI